MNDMIKEQRTTKKVVVDACVMGFALFAMFFGAGNLVFPPYLGLQTGSQWLLAFFCYFLADCGLAVIAIFAMLHLGNMEAVINPAGRVPSIILMCACIIAIGPGLAIPRTAAVSFEMSVLPSFPNVSSWVYAVIFFAVVLALSISRAAVVDIIGKFLTPALLIGILILVIMGIVNPLGEISPEALIEESVVGTGVAAGYQTMDVLGALIMGTIVMKSALDKGYKLEDGAALKVTGYAAIVAGIALMVVYGGLAYLGASVSQIYGVDIDRTTLVMTIVEMLMGKAGVIIIGIVVLLACLTTAIGLTCSAADYFDSLTNGKLSYKMVTIIICVISAVTCNLGLNTIISIAAPILGIIYPPMLILIALAFCTKFITNHWIHKMAIIGSLLVEIPVQLGICTELVSKLPFYSSDFAWFPVAVIFGIIGAFIKPKKAA